MIQEIPDIAARIWQQADGPASVLEALTSSGPRQVLPSYFDVTGLATGSVAAATLAACGGGPSPQTGRDSAGIASVQVITLSVCGEGRRAAPG